MKPVAKFFKHTKFFSKPAPGYIGSQEYSDIDLEPSKDKYENICPAQETPIQEYSDFNQKFLREMGIKTQAPIREYADFNQELLKNAFKK